MRYTTVFFTRTANYGTTHMKDCPILSFVLPLLFEVSDDDYMKETNVFNHLWFIITNDGLKSIRKFSDYTVKSVMNEQLKSQSTSFQALPTYYCEDVFSLLQECKVAEK
ncbi:unnamed protein product [Rotaria sp. Silwood1]|nr:unnamed protein product [Rotaria sp. Silwood1]